MAKECLAFSTDASCVVVRPSPQRDAVVIAASVGAAGANKPTDVRAIQSALNDVPSANGGPTPPLKVDGIVGSKTLAAIKHFQQTHVKVVDSRIDPKGRTLAALNAELGSTVPIAAQGLTGAAQGTRVPEFLPPDPEILATVVRLLGRIREVIRAATFRLATVDRFITNQKLSVPQGPFLANVRESVEILEAAFSIGKINNPRPPFDNIKRVFQNMTVALNRTFETAPLIAPVLFVPNTHISMEPRAAAYTSRGGAFFKPGEKLDGINEPADRIYVCRNMLKAPEDFQVAALVHELAHFVSGQPIEVVDVVKQGTMLKLRDRPRFNAIRPEDKIRSAEHYSFFAMAAKSPKFLVEGI
jgi:hypothetical protein